MTQTRTAPISDVLIIGAGPVGLTLANLLGQQGVDVILVEKSDELIDYPRAVGIDDEALRAMQTADIVDHVLLEGLERFPTVTVRFGTEVIDLVEEADGVVATLADGETLGARWVVA